MFSMNARMSVYEIDATISILDGCQIGGLNMDKRIEFVLKYLDDNLGGKVLLKDVAETVNLSGGYLSELFSKEVGINFCF